MKFWETVSMRRDHKRTRHVLRHWHKCRRECLGALGKLEGRLVPLAELVFQELVGANLGDKGRVVGLKERLALLWSDSILEACDVNVEVRDAIIRWGSKQVTSEEEPHENPLLSGDVAKNTVNGEVLDVGETCIREDLRRERLEKVRRKHNKRALVLAFHRVLHPSGVGVDDVLDKSGEPKRDDREVPRRDKRLEKVVCENRRGDVTRKCETLPRSRLALRGNVVEVGVGKTRLCDNGCDR